MSKHRRRGALLLLAVAVVSVMLLGDARRRPAAGAAGGDAVTTLLAAVAPAGFERAQAPRVLRFPRDHAAHPGFRTEWWYFTGNLHDASGREFGFQLTLFRFELAPDAPASPSAWRTPRVMMGHFALSDVAAREFHAFERVARAASGVAGVDSDPIAIRIDDWRIRHRDGGWQLSARQQGIAITLELDAGADIVAHGDGGLSHKSGAPGNASYYYSVPRLGARGEVQLGDERYAVRGRAWLDREWSTSALDRTQEGWDWFGLQLDDGSSLMFYRLRGSGGTTDRHSAGSHVGADGRVTTLGAADVELTAERYWTSPHGGTRYPVQWRLAVPRLDLDLRVAPRFDAQEWRGRFRYWEGAVAVSGQRGGQRLGGRGYLELTGYAAPLR